MDNHQPSQHLLMQTRTRILFLVLIFFYLIGIFAYVLSYFRSDDPLPEVKAVPLEMRKEYQDFSAVVKAGLFINNFPEIDFIKNHAVVDAIVWFEYNKSELMLSTIDEFSFENSKILGKSKPTIRRYGDRILVKYNIKFEVKTDIAFYRFPLEDHRLSIILKNDSVTAEEMRFDDDEYALSFKIEDAFVSNWKIEEKYKMSGYEPLFIDENKEHRVINVPKVAFIVDFRKAGINKILLILVPIFAAVFLSLFTFLMSFNSYMGKYTLSITAITALLGYRFVIQQMSPPVGYFTIADKLFIFFLALCFFIFAFQVMMVRQYMFLMERKNLTQAELALTDVAVMTPRKTELIGNVVFYLLSVVLVIVVTIFIL